MSPMPRAMRQACALEKTAPVRITGAVRFIHPSVTSSIETPAGAVTQLAAGDAGAGVAVTPAIGGGAELTADLAPPAGFPLRGEGAVVGTAAPFIGPADIAVQAVDIDRIGLGLVLAI